MLGSAWIRGVTIFVAYFSNKDSCTQHKTKCHTKEVYGTQSN